MSVLSWVAVAASTRTHGRPIATEFPKKISANPLQRWREYPSGTEPAGHVLGKSHNQSFCDNQNGTARELRHQSMRHATRFRRSSAKACSPRPSKVTHFRKRAGIIRSVSMSSPGTGTPRPVMWLMTLLVLIPRPFTLAGEDGCRSRRR